MNARKYIALSTSALVLGSGLITASALPSAAASQKAQRPVVEAQQSARADRASCPWPYVCFYKGGRRVGAYKDMGYQRLGRQSQQATSVYNSRNDDGARVYGIHSSGARRWSCARPNSRYHVTPGWRLYAIDIRNSPSCK
ncbi:hypothetical protein [Streptomyces sp. NPDC003077]|uniref:hypothetical protein n=1 Tax=Streptomyces sp. NPDC003077 TaxID=3154443 RepID=UPI0033A2EB25